MKCTNVECTNGRAVSSHNLNSQHVNLRVSNPVSKYIELCARPWQMYHFSRDMYACNNSKPQDLEEILRHELLKIDRTRLTKQSRLHFSSPAQLYYGQFSKARLVWSGLAWSGLVWSGLVWSGLAWSSHSVVYKSSLFVWETTFAKIGHFCILR